MFIFEKKEESTAMENFTITDLENESIFNNLIIKIFDRLFSMTIKEIKEEDNQEINVGVEEIKIILEIYQYTFDLILKDNLRLVNLLG